MSVAERPESASRLPSFSAPAGKCPYYPANVLGVLGSLFVAPDREKNLQPNIEQYVALTQVLAIFSVRAEKAHLKRGPPFA